MEDMLLYVRQQCYVKFKGKKNMKLVKNKHEPDDMVAEDMPAKYFFTGYFSFALFGPQATSGVTL